MIALFCASLISIGLAAESRIALVIGNGSYPNVPLKNPVNDARDLASSLKGLGFEVSLVVDGDMAAMTKAVREFGNAIKRPDAVALFYYSGHGIQYKGANYLIPAKADIQDPDELAFAAVNAEQVYAKMESSGDKTNIVILDACRNNPFPGAERASERGLAIVASAPPQSLIVYATAPGKTAQDGAGRNGAFTSALLKHLAEPGLDVELMIRKVREDVISATGGAQVPWHNSSISGEGFSFAGGGRLLVSTEPTGAEVLVDGQVRGLSPLSLSGLPRYSEIEVSARSGSKSATRRLTLTDSSEAKLQLSLEAARGSILVAASEKVLTALLDGREVAIGPKGTIEGVEAGSHELELRGDSSGYKARVEVGADRQAKVSAALLPMGSLTIAIPEGTRCAIEGSGFSDTTASYNYGPLPAGTYRLTVTGGDYEDHVEAVRIERGKRLDFAPVLRYASEYLSARYGAELARLQRVAEAGVSSQADVDDATALAKRIKAESRPELSGLASKADALKASLVSQRPAASGGQAAANSGRSTGTLTLTSDPPGMEVSVDGGTAVATPFSLELAPGAHSFEPLQSSIGYRWYAAQSLQWITVTAGSETSVPIRLKPETAYLKIRLAPEGYKVFVNGKEVGETPLAAVEVPAGAMDLRFEKEGEKTRVMFAGTRPGDTTTLSWGANEETAIQLQRQTVKLDGKADSWEGIEPIFQAAGSSKYSFLGQEAFGPSRIYLCKDDKYLYWRVDFNEKNPFQTVPAGTSEGITLQLSPWFSSMSKGLDMAVQYNREGNGQRSYLGSYNAATLKWKELESNVITTKQAKAMFVARLSLDYVNKYSEGQVGNIEFTLVNCSRTGWIESSRLAFKIGFVDFSR
jgi:hypothetical protein